MSDEVGRLRAAVDGCEVEVRFVGDAELSEPMRAALVELAEAMYAERVAAAPDDAEVSGFGLKVGGLGLGSAGVDMATKESCWGYSKDYCYWFTHENPGTNDGPKGCGIYSWY